MSGQPLAPQAFPGFRFIVEVAGESKAAFLECTLPTLEWEAEEVREGGINTYTRLLPGRRRSARISFRNGVGNSELMQWYYAALQGKFMLRNVTVTLMKLVDEKLMPVMTWEISDAFPTRWNGPQLRSDENTIAIQTLEMACGEIKVKLAGQQN